MKNTFQTIREQTNLSENLINVAESIYNSLKEKPAICAIFPTERNSIQFEYDDIWLNYLEFEIFEDHTDVLFIDEVGEESSDKLINNDTDKFKEWIDCFLGHGELSDLKKQLRIAKEEARKYIELEDELNSQIEFLELKLWEYDDSVKEEAHK